MFIHGGMAFFNMMMLPHLLFIYNYVRNDLNDEALGTLFMALLHMTFAMYTNSVGNFNACEIYDYILHDIPPEEEEEIELLPRQNIRFDSWTNQTCYHHTNFTKDHLLRIYECFLLRQIADQTNGFIKVPTGHVNQRGRICCYNFHPGVTSALVASIVLLLDMMAMEDGRICFVRQ